MSLVKGFLHRGYGVKEGAGKEGFIVGSMLMMGGRYSRRKRTGEEGEGLFTPFGADGHV